MVNRYRKLVTIILLLLSLFSIPHFRILGNMKTVTKPAPPKKYCALTFDDGPDPRFTPQVLKILRKEKIPATFFVVGQNAAKYPDLIKEIYFQGNEIENHTYTHPVLNYFTDNTNLDLEIKKTDAVVYAKTHYTPAFFRPPRGRRPVYLYKILARNKKTLVMWDICVESVIDKKKTNFLVPKNKVIILAHDGRLDRSKTIKALPQVIKQYKDAGYQFVTINQLHSLGVK
ncbi:polysaccharide deacetylase [Carboxydothermus hydrogenoformans Z-2901]|uniref:Polysaccharide deacetylase n=2 Tax=Carboxydothermus hydrogenoformans TaxID=129958 RepID=Q3AB15_CARHZ|nr:polysaccharide deacetylase [Carboxydothermus hydrogenoformans Z-2901]